MQKRGQREWESEVAKERGIRKETEIDHKRARGGERARWRERKEEKGRDKERETVRE